MPAIRSFHTNHCILHPLRPAVVDAAHILQHLDDTQIEEGAENEARSRGRCSARRLPGAGAGAWPMQHCHAC